MIVRPGPVIDFLLFNQNIDHPSRIDWVKVKTAFQIWPLLMLLLCSFM